LERGYCMHVFLVFTLKKLCEQKVLESQQNAQLRILCDLWNVITTITLSQWYEVKISDVETWKWFGLFIWETDKFQLYVFSYGTEMPTWKVKLWCLWTSEICYDINKVCLLNVKYPKNITTKMFCYLFTKYNQNG
jgi:hypothetical protein